MDYYLYLYKNMGELNNNQGRPDRQTNDSATFALISFIGIVVLVIVIGLLIYFNNIIFHYP